MAELKGTGEVYIEIRQENGKPVFTLKDNTTEGAVLFVPNDDGFELQAKKGTYTFFYEAVGFEFAADAVTFLSTAHRNLAWVRPNDDPHVVAMSDLNFVTADQIVEFFLNPAEPFHALFTRQNPIDPTVLNLPDPPLALAAQDLTASVAA